jgi:hypothetical protein
MSKEEDYAEHVLTEATLAARSQDFSASAVGYAKHWLRLLLGAW